MATVTAIHARTTAISQPIKVITSVLTCPILSCTCPNAKAPPAAVTFTTRIKVSVSRVVNFMTSWA